MVSPIRVWVLGAGFSKSLGAPLLPDLLSLNAQAEVRSRWSDLPHLDGAALIYWLYHYGTQFAEGVPEGLRLTGVRAWQHAEDFLETLAAGAQIPAIAGKLSELVSDLKEQVEGAGGLLPIIEESEKLDVLARRLVGAACCAFLEDVDFHAVHELEKWRPYRDWFRQLDEGDFLISYNYDRVVEQLNFWRAVKGGGGRLTVVTNREEADAAKTGKAVPLMKLHGSVDWRRGKDGSVTRTEDPLHVLHCESDELSLAAPGPSKLRIAKQSFDAIWKLAADVLKVAEEIYFLGYRFPPSDAESRSHLLGAISENLQKQIRVQLVLGPEVKSPTVVRVEQLLRETLRKPMPNQPRRSEVVPGPGHQGFNIKVHPLWVEDFLTVWYPEMPFQYP